MKSIFREFSSFTEGRFCRGLPCKGQSTCKKLLIIYHHHNEQHGFTMNCDNGKALQHTLILKGVTANAAGTAQPDGTMDFTR